MSQLKVPWALALIAAAAVLIWAPTLGIAAPGDSFSYDVNWSAQFTRQFLAGNAYPRWMAGSFAGLGAPVFYFYPPGPFWVTALISGVSGGWLSAGDQVKTAELFFLMLSGATMFAWLRTRAGVTASLLGALLFMVAPYHLDDHFVRGAFAEFAAIALLPLVGLGLAKTGAGDRLGPVWLALGWAGVILCHLPIALLAGVLLVAPYGALLIYQAKPQRGLVALKIGLALAMGLGLAAIYILPSASLQDWISAEYWWSGKFQVGDRLFANPASWSKPLEPFLGLFSLGEAGLAAFIGWRAWKGGDRGVLFWAGLVVLLFLIMAGLVPGFWSLPLMAKVQFPWRAMAIEDFAFVTLIVWAPRPARSPMVFIILGSLIFGNLVAVGRDILAAPVNPAVARAGYGVTSFPTTADAPEYLPKGMLLTTPDGPGLVVPLDRLKALPLVSDPLAAASADPVTGAVHLSLPAAHQGPIVLRRFYFPGWDVQCGGYDIPAAPTGPARLVSFIPPAGPQTCDARITATIGERFGGELWLFCLVFGLAYWVWAVRSLRRAVLRPS